MNAGSEPDLLALSAGRIDGQDWTWAFTRCWLLVAQCDIGRFDAAGLRAAVEAFELIPTGVAGRARLAALLVNQHLRLGGTTTPHQVDRLAALSAAADEDPQPFVQWPFDRAAARSLWLMVHLQHGRAGVDGRSALAELDGLAEVVAGRHPHAEMVAAARVLARHVAALASGDLTESVAVVQDIGDLGGRVPPGSGPAAMLEIVQLMQRCSAAAARGDLVALGPLLDELEAHRDRLPRGAPGVSRIDALLQTVRPLLGLAEPADTDPLAGLRRLAESAGTAPAERALRLTGLGTAELAAGRTDLAIGHLREAAEIAPADDARTVEYLMTLGVALVSRYEDGRSRPDLVEATTALDRAATLAGGPAHPHWPVVAMTLAWAQRLRGYHALGRSTGQGALRGHAMAVLVQSGTGAAATAARHAAGEAVAVARWCLEDGDYAGAVQALDAGRGLLLEAAIRFGTVADQLDDADLARQWRATVGDGDPAHAPAALRHAVAARLAGTTARGQSRLDPLSLPEIRAALAKFGAGALVYLMAGEAGAGAAVVVPVDGEPSLLLLPLLNDRSAAPLDRFVGALVANSVRSGRDMSVHGGGRPPDPDLPDALEDVCRWAWRAAVRPLLTAFGTGWGRSPRLVLVPMGALGRVPWHAARDDRTGTYAVEHATFSVAVSARMFCDGVWSTGSVTSPATEAVTVGDPDTGGVAEDLVAARSEALAIRDVFHPRACYLGRTADGRRAREGAGTPAELRAALVAASEGATLHAACHGVVAPGDDDEPTSYLMLAVGDPAGSRLTAEDLLQTVRSGRRRRLGLAVLAACSTGVPSRGYDEAFSTASAFLAAGTGSVISALWAIPDGETSVLMFMVHHFCRLLPPVSALRAAQLSMLRPDREIPEAMPAVLRDRLAASTPAAVASWAGFVHAGR